MMKGIPAWLFLGGIWRNGRRLEWQEWRSTRDMTHKPLFPGFLNSYLSWPPKAVKTNCKTGSSFKHLLVFDLVLYFKRWWNRRQSRQGVRSDTVPLPCIIRSKGLKVSLVLISKVSKNSPTAITCKINYNHSTSWKGWCVYGCHTY